MATIRFTTPSLLSFTNQTQTKPARKDSSTLSCKPTPTPSLISGAYRVTVEHQGQTTELQVSPEESILSKALDLGLDIPHDCKLGVCMTCPAKLLTGKVDQSEGMLSDDVIERGYALLCVAYPTEDCTIRTIPEEELLSLQLATAKD